MKICKIEGCEGKHSAKGFCSYHYQLDLVKQKGFRNLGEYKNYLAREKGFKNHDDYRQYRKAQKILCKATNDGEGDENSLFYNIDFIEKLTNQKLGKDECK